MTVSLRIGRIDVAAAEAKKGPIATAATSAYVMAARRDSEQYVPYLTGDLRRSAETESQPERALLVYGSAAVPYARPQYYGCPRKTWPGTTTEWFDAAKAAHGPEWIKEAQAAAREAAGR
ncbi:minor capsid protein [Gordonibacter sp. An230]|uniref:minor capsid protein n=1 Tax=Gordonibacter sp. An230 TaxID=1965592 RepID=UPI0013A64CFE|nr:minor capsid protein [Gordonibacter sp. An230]